MTRKRNVLLAACCVLAGLLLFGAGVLLGRLLPREERVIVYARVTSVDEKSLRVEEIPSNEPLSVQLVDGAVIQDRSGNTISLTDIPIGAVVKMECEDYRLEIYPAIVRVYSIFVTNYQ